MENTILSGLCSWKTPGLFWKASWGSLPRKYNITWHWKATFFQFGITEHWCEQTPDFVFYSYFNYSFYKLFTNFKMCLEGVNATWKVTYAVSILYKSMQVLGILYEFIYMLVLGMCVLLSLLVCSAFGIFWLPLWRKPFILLCGFTHTHDHTTVEVTVFLMETIKSIIQKNNPLVLGPIFRFVLLQKSHVTYFR